MRTATNNLLSILLLSGLLCPLVSLGQDSLNVSRIERINLWTVPTGAVVHDSLLLVSTLRNTGILLFDISDALNPVYLSQYFIPVIESRVSVWHDRAIFLGSGSVGLPRLCILDISDPYAPVMVDSSTHRDDSYAIWGDTLVWIERNPAPRKMKLIDLSNGEDIEDARIWLDVPFGRVYDFGEYLGGLIDGPTLALYSVLPNGFLEQQSQISFLSDVVQVMPIGEYFLVLCQAHLYCVSIDETEVVTDWVRDIESQNAGSMQLEGGRLYIRGGNTAYQQPNFFTFDLSNILEPQLIGNGYVASPHYYFDVFGTWIYLPMYNYSTKTGISIFDASNADSLFEMKHFDSPGPALNLARLDTLIFAGRNEVSGVWNISDPQHIEFAGQSLWQSIETHFWNGHAYVALNNVYIVYRMTNPFAPETVWSHVPEGSPYSAGPGVFGCGDGLYGVNLGGPGRFRPMDVVWNFQVYDSLTVVSGAEIEVLRNSDWTTVGRFSIGSRDVCMRGNIVYAASPANGIYVISFEDMQNPVLLPTIPIQGETRRLVLDGNILMACSRTGGLRLYDVTVPEAPELIGFWDADDPAASVEDVILVDSIAYVAEYYRLTVLNCSEALAMAGPPAPIGLTFKLSFDNLILRWKRTPRATSYAVWSKPNYNCPESFFTLETTTTDTDAALPIPQSTSRHYFVKALRD